MLRWLGAVLLAALLSLPGPVGASEGGGKKDAGNLIRIVIMLPLLNPGTLDVLRIVPITLDINIDTPEVKESLVTQMPKLQDAFLAGSYGKVYTNWGYDQIQTLLTGILMKTIDEDFRDAVHLSIRINVKQQ